MASTEHQFCLGAIRPFARPSPVLERLVCTGSVAPHCSGECFQWETLQSHGETPGCKRQGLAGKCLVHWSPVIPAVHQGCRSSERQAALHFPLPMSRSFYISISFGCGQGQKVSEVLRSVGGVGRSPGSRRASPVQGAGRWETLLLSHRLGQSKRRGAGSWVCSQMGQQDSRWDAPGQGRLLERASRKKDLSLLQNL